MKKQAKRAAAFLAAASLAILATANIPSAADSNKPEIKYSTHGHGPSLLLLHDSSETDLAWAKAARELATRFEVTLVDITELINDNKSVQRLRKALSDLDIDDAHISGSARAEHLALRYALSFPDQSNSFILPQNCDDLEILAELVNSTPFKRS